MVQVPRLCHDVLATCGVVWPRPHLHVEEAKRTKVHPKGGAVARLHYPLLLCYSVVHINYTSKDAAVHIDILPAAQHHHLSSNVLQDLVEGRLSSIPHTSGE